MYWSYLKTFTFLLTLALIFGGGYVLYRYSVAQAFEAGTYSGEDVPATLCTLQVSNFDTSYVGVAYFIGQKERIDMEIRDKTGVYIQHQINDGYTAYEWRDSESTAHEVPIDEVNLPNPRGLFSNKDCKPMWSVPPTLLEIPGISV